MITEEIAYNMDGCEYGAVTTALDRRYAKDNDAVIVFGASDDLIVFQGAIRDEADCYGGATIYFNHDGVLQSECEDDECPYFEKIKIGASKIKAIWDSEGYAWTYETDIPHETFDIMDGGEKYCRGIVFKIDDVMEQEQVLIRIVPDGDEYDRAKYASIELYVGGKMVGDEYIGGEPEDNMWTRDYEWIAPMLQTLAEKLGAHATVVVEDSDNTNKYLIDDSWSSNQESVITSMADAIEYFRSGGRT